MKRLFVFGCSYTKYIWPTWADLISFNFERTYNQGKLGAGNLYIYLNFIKKITELKISKKDTVIIQWTNVAREDRFINGDWKSVGNIYTQSFYSKDFIKNFCDYRGFYERDIPLIHSAYLILESLGCEYEMLSMVDIFYPEQFKNKMIDESEILHLKKLYNESLLKIKPSFYKVIFNYDYNSRPIQTLPKRIDKHPLPSEHLEFINKILPQFKISSEVKNYAYVEDLKAIDLQIKKINEKII